MLVQVSQACSDRNSFLELETERNLKHSRIILLLGNDAKVGSVQAVARVLKAHVVEDIKCVGPELETLVFRPRQQEILEKTHVHVRIVGAANGVTRAGRATEGVGEGGVCGTLTGKKLNLAVF